MDNYLYQVVCLTRYDLWVYGACTATALYGMVVITDYFIRQYNKKKEERRGPGESVQ